MCDLFSKPIPPATLSKAYVIKMIRQDIEVHKLYRGYVEADPALGNTSYGTVEHHDKWIEIFVNALHYLTK